MSPRLVACIRSVIAGSSLALVLAGCGGEESDDPASTRPDDVAKSDERIVLGDLPQGPLPEIDVTIGSTLIHDGTEIEMPRWADQPSSIAAMGTYDDRPIVDSGAQFYTVADDGTTKPLGEPFHSYNYPSRLVTESGHLLAFFSDRGTGQLTVTVLDASTGAELAVLPEGDDLTSLDPADRAVIEVVTGDVAPPPRVVAVSPDGSVTVAVRNRFEFPAVLSVGPVDGGEDATILKFEGESYHVVFESNDTFLVAVAEPEDDLSKDLKYVVVRCTVDGACERTTEPSVDVSIAGADGVDFGTVDW